MLKIYDFSHENISADIELNRHIFFDKKGGLFLDDRYEEIPGKYGLTIKNNGDFGASVEVEGKTLFSFTLDYSEDIGLHIRVD